ncbi:Cof-like hydrolase [Coprococcus eutactus ATCC 27759]|nr:Cof-like hydrolase [Coprococcus eutactus ATCC 27759]
MEEDMRKKLLALDIDGTLTNTQKDITPETLKKIIEVQEKGHVVAIASGRPLPGIRKIADIIQLDRFGGYVLAFNGGRIVNYKTGEVVYQAALDNEIVRDIYDYCLKVGCGMVTYDGDRVITGTDIDGYMTFEASINHMELMRIDDFKEYIDFPLNKCLLTAEPDKAEKIEEELVSRFGDKVTIFRSEPYFVEIMPQNVHKATSLEKLLGVLNMDVRDLIACGDGYNDLTMIEYAGVGVAMANAQDIVKKHADYITLSNDEDGLVPVVDKFILGVENI